MIEYNYLPLGYDSKPTRALQKLGLKKLALPFDWVQITHDQAIKCIDDHFHHWHQNMTLVKFPHDYPPALDNSKNNLETVRRDDVVFDDTIIDIQVYQKYKNIVLEKYRRKIQHLYQILEDKSKPLIVLIYGTYYGAVVIKDYLQTKFNRKNIIVVVGIDELFILHPFPLIPYCVPGPSNDSNSWLDAINRGIHAFKAMAKPTHDEHDHYHAQHHAAKIHWYDSDNEIIC